MVIVLRDDRNGEERRIYPSNALWWMTDEEAHRDGLLPSWIHIVARR